MHYQGTSNFVVVEKLKAFKTNLKRWNKEVFRKVEDRKKQATKKSLRCYW